MGMVPRTTRQKKLIEALISKQKGFFNAEDLYEKIKGIDSGIGIATIYRNLKQLVSEGILHVYTCDRRQVYSKTKQHCHFIDEITGKVTHFEIKNLDFLKGKLPGAISSFQIEIRGTTNKK
jgi:Fe2+ or Zn2+ uptake regulation protein